jgi:hypothetical protein
VGACCGSSISSDGFEKDGLKMAVFDVLVSLPRRDFMRAIIPDLRCCLAYDQEVGRSNSRRKRAEADFTAMGGFCAHAAWRNDKVSAKITDI